MSRVCPVTYAHAGKWKHGDAVRMMFRVCHRIALIFHAVKDASFVIRLLCASYALMNMSTHELPPFALKDGPIENQRRLKVRVIGAGYSGIYLGVRIPQRLRNIDLQIYEKNEAVGGTWWTNRYPGETSSGLAYKLSPSITSDRRMRV
jgi:hypothetical protein